MVGQNIQTGTTAAGTAFTRFVEGDEHPASTNRNVEPEKKDFWDSFGAPPSGPSADKKDFWDEFSSAGETKTQNKSLGTGAMGAQKKPSGIGTSAMKKKKEDETWGDW
jgi:ADP-ribosylation factor GTPase-activating protein 1